MEGEVKAREQVAQWDIEDGAVDLVLYGPTGEPLTDVKTVAYASGLTVREAAMYLKEAVAIDPSQVNPTLRMDIERYDEDTEHASTACIMLIPENPENIAVEWGVPVEELHLTMVFFTEADLFTLSRDKFFELVEDQMLFPITGELNGLTVFYSSADKGKNVLVLNVDSPLVEDFRIGLLQQCKDRNIVLSRTHGYSPHITIAYLDNDTPVPDHDRTPKPVRFTRLRASYGKWTREYIIKDGEEKPEGIEVKGLRRVRTPKGSRKYGQPIGTVIARDKIKKITDMHLPSVTTQIENGHGKRDKPIEFVTGYKAYVGTSSQWDNTNIPRFWNIEIHDPRGRRILNTSIGGLLYEGISLEEGVEKAHAKAVADGPTFVSVGDKSYLAQSSDGIYGLDWTWGDEPMVNVADLEARKKAAEVEGQELGLVYNEGLDQIHAPDLPYFIKEVVNLSMRSHMEIWPNFTKAIRHFETITDKPPHSPTLAYTKHTFGITDDVIAFNRGHFNNPGVSGIGVGWNSIDKKLLEEEFNLTEISAAKLYTTVHELGHVIGTTFADYYSGKDFVGDMKPSVRIQMCQEFKERLDEIVQEQFGYQSINTLLSRGKKHIRKHVSEYGSRNLQEFLAECWAGYMLSPIQTELVNSVGSLMEELYTEYMEVVG